MRCLADIVHCAGRKSAFQTRIPKIGGASDSDSEVDAEIGGPGPVLPSVARAARGLGNRLPRRYPSRKHQFASIATHCDVAAPGAPAEKGKFSKVVQRMWSRVVGFGLGRAFARSQLCSKVAQQLLECCSGASGHRSAEFGHFRAWAPISERSPYKALAWDFRPFRETSRSTSFARSVRAGDTEFVVVAPLEVIIAHILPMLQARRGDEVRERRGASAGGGGTQDGRGRG